MIDYTIFYKESLGHGNNWNLDNQYSLFISAYNLSVRVKETFEKVSATKKHWLLFPQYEFHQNEYPQDNYFYFQEYDEDVFLIKYMESLHDSMFENICVDITGFIRPHLIYLMGLLSKKQIKKLDIIYSEPVHYEKKEETSFSSETEGVRQIPGFSGDIQNAETNKDILIIGAGYDDKLIMDVAREKRQCRVYQILGLPSLQPDMYQENVYKIYVNNAIDDLRDSKSYYAPANDPFVTAQTIQEIVKRNTDYTNIYLSPLSTKAQTLGFALYYLWEAKNQPISIIFPYAKKYHKRTTEGLTRTWKYTVHLLP
jgi:hypothetical protein